MGKLKHASKLLFYIRVLKELGVYKAYKDGRVLTGKPCVFSDSTAHNSGNFNTFIDRSFFWSETGNEAMWENIYYKINLDDKSLREALCDGTILEI